MVVRDSLSRVSQRGLAVILVAALLVVGGASAVLAFTMGGRDNPLVCEPGPAAGGIELTHCRGYALNSLIVEIAGTAPGQGDVFVEYGTDATGWFRTADFPVEDGRFEGQVLRLRPETTYDFRVYQEQDGGRLEGPRGSFTTGPLPLALQRADIQVEGDVTAPDRLVLLDFNLLEHEESPAFSGFVALDSAGEVVWYVETESTSPGDVMTQTPSGTIAFIPDTYGIVEITPLGEIVDRMEAPCPDHHAFHHEIVAVDEDVLLFMSREIREVPELGHSLQEGDTIWIWDKRTSEAYEVWNIFDQVDPTAVRTASSDLTEGYMWRGCSGEEPVQDWSHGNSVKPAPDGSWILSARHLDQVMAIAPDFSTINWRLGGTNSDFTFEDPDAVFHHQHSAWQLPNGNVLLFDNGNGRNGPGSDSYSRALELELDWESMAARKVWEYRHDPDLYAECCSSVDRLPNGNTLVVFGSEKEISPCCHTFTLVEASPAGDAVWTARIFAPGKMIQYRGYPAESIMGETVLPDG